jgi:hypothetical protein
MPTRSTSLALNKRKSAGMDDRAAKLFAGHMGVSVVLASVLIEKGLVSSQELRNRLRQAHTAAVRSKGGDECAQALSALLCFLERGNEQNHSH